MPTIISRQKRNPWGDIMGGIGQGLSGFSGGYMGRQQLDLAKQNAQNTQAMTQALMGKVFGAPGSINPMSGAAPTAEPMSPPAGMTPPTMAPTMPMQANARPAMSGAGLSTNDLAAMLLAQGVIPRFGG